MALKVSTAKCRESCLCSGTGKLFSQELPVIKVNFRGLHLAAELLSEVMFSASRVINFRCLVITNICSQYILQVPSGVVEKAQFVIQSDQVRVMFRELTF